MSLSIALALHNEEKNISRCLESVYDWVDEIVIVDGQSTDKTIDIIKSFDTKGIVKIFTEPNLAMFHINKQKAIERCIGEWILQLDADEVVSEELKNEIKTVISNVVRDPNGISPSANTRRNDNGDAVAYWIPRLNYFLGKPLKKGGQYPDYTIRLYKNGVAHFPCKSVHEQVEILNTKYKILYTKVGHLTTDLLHYPYPTFDVYLEKWTRYALLEADILNKQGTRPSFANFIKYMIVYPKMWFLKTYLRHKGFTDGFAGFVFCLFSALRYVVTYSKLYELNQSKS